ncbi:predicted nucleoside-diphosphate-sugar epimerase [Serpentinimonas maccroryi]|uniref:Predicted nucleoside-diphosphate-sugar epimerase n=1 Tax=Serpentinimonas maccroryi TaxID=1458426 RepID=A0A060NRG2_9BURK|nr:complex I NDUFA9 subunit family protein [Serpentinimonas maccroryi]MCM2479009.1 complex I NDUFA9 subunit family protein [Serpentinimonas maccroryi]OYX59699.1 MAG: NAD-dependent dehydratase [Comamonadaceae bacterium 32-67-11]BAO83945.1 predicted nucleoside-diphosphate-sugar epimerase [Serpentinimonas maccroryi]
MKNVLVLGGTGFVGRHLCEHLNRAGIRATVPTRRLNNAQAVQMLPLVQPLEADVHDAAALARLLPGHDAVVNLIAVLHGSRARFEQVHVELPRRLAAAMQASGVRRLVHVSALGASASGPSEYQRSKAAGEAVLQAAGLELTILRPSVIFGAEDRFLNLFASLQKLFPLMPLAGSQARLQPVWVGDVARALLHCLLHPATSGQIIECAGPETFSLADLVRLAGRLSGHPRPVLPLPRALGYAQALLMQLLPGEPLLSADNLRSLEVDNVASGQLPDLRALGIEPQALEPLAARYLDQAGRADPLLALRKHAVHRK